MRRSKTRGLTSNQKRDLWERWQKGQSLSEIGRALGKHASSISGVSEKTSARASYLEQLATYSEPVRDPHG